MLREKLFQTMQGGAGRVIVDLAGVEYMDSSGLATLVEAVRNSKKQGVELILCRLNPRVRAIFEIARLERFFRIVDSVEQACSC